MSDLPADIDSINHVGMAVRDLGAAARCFEAMGFMLTPYSPHSAAWKPGEAVKPQGSGNRCVMLPHNYLEVLASELGDRSTVVDLIDTFLVELPGRIDGIVASGAAGDRDGLHRLVHTLTSSARLLGAASLATACHEFEHDRLGADAVVALAAKVRDELGIWSGSN